MANERVERVVYILGAGFSAPLDLPVMSDFYHRSKDLFRVNREEHAEFSRVFDVVQSLLAIKNYYSADLTNIEEILSTLEMRASLSGNAADQRAMFQRYIAATISALTPPVSVEVVRASNWDDVFLRRTPADLLLRFVAQAFSGEFVGSPHEGGIRVTLTPGNQPREEVLDAGRTGAMHYDFVTLNYDCLLERAASAWATHNRSNAVEFIRGDGLPVANPAAPHLLKLHGSADSPATIVPPSWRKDMHPEIAGEWERALEVLAEADYIRIIGYSLPESDSYIKYLLKSAINTNWQNLKRVDVVCRDDTNAVRQRYEDFVVPGMLRFLNADAKHYWTAVEVRKTNDEQLSTGSRKTLKPNLQHDRFMTDDDLRARIKLGQRR